MCFDQKFCVLDANFFADHASVVFVEYAKLTKLD